MEILEITPRWYHGFTNDPGINVIVDEILPYDSFVYKNVNGKPDHTMLISTNNDPWVKFVYIEKPDGRPEQCGALGGKYKLTDGTVLESRTGWSSRAGIINRDFRDELSDEIVEVSIKTKNDSMWWGGFNIYQTHLHNHPKWPVELFLVRTLKFNREPYWNISTDPDSITKPKENRVGY